MAEILGTAGNDTLAGTANDDRLIGLLGADKMSGGTGEDTYIVDDAGEVVIEAATKDEIDTDTVIASISTTLAANVERLDLVGPALNGAGNGLGNILIGNNLGNKLDGGAGSDFLAGNDGNDLLLGGLGDDFLFGGAGKDRLQGGAGNDSYLISDDEDGDIIVEVAGQGIDTINVDVSFDLALRGANVENLRLNGGENGFGNALDNLIRANNGANFIDGRDDNDIVQGQLGDDTLIGGNGNDNLSGEGPNDTLEGGAGNDTLDGGDGINTLRGGLGNDRLVDDGGNDELDGGAGADTMSGGGGFDIYHVDNAKDVVIEGANQGFDLVLASIGTYTLGANVEDLSFAVEAGAAIGTGNALANGISGNIFADKLDGQGGNDTLFGEDGNDTLIGGAGNDDLFGGAGKDSLDGGAGSDELNGGLGADVMVGGGGNDLYVVDDAGDKVTEAANGGNDTVFTFIDLILGANVENAQALAGGRAITGNDLNNVLIGDLFNDGADTFNGGKGADTLLGKGGNDILNGGDGNDVMDGGSGADTMNGGAGADLFLYRLDNNADLANLGGDIINGFQHGQDKIDLLDLFDDFDINAADPFADGFLAIEVVGGNTLIKFDSNGGGDGFVTLATLTGVNNVTAQDLLVPPPIPL